MNAAPPDDRIRAQAQLETVAGRIYADPAAALLAMRNDANDLGPEAVRRRLEDDFTRYGAPAGAVQGPARNRVQTVLRENGLAADMGRWLAEDRPAPASPVQAPGEAVMANAPEALGPSAVAAPERGGPETREKD